ncbi:MAG: sigma-70 family RNA polymerase sigma factor [Myxococcota bacterium]
MKRSRSPLRAWRINRLALRAQRGELSAFEALYRDVAPLIARYVRRRVADASDAEDVIGTTLTKLIEGLGRFDPREGSFEAWALRIARNAAIDHWRRSRPTLPCVEDEPISTNTPLDVAIAKQAAQQVREVLTELPNATREILELRMVEGLAYHDIAALQDTTSQVVRQRLSRALKRIKEKLHAEEHTTDGRKTNVARSRTP